MPSGCDGGGYEMLVELTEAEREALAKISKDRCVDMFSIEGPVRRSLVEQKLIEGQFIAIDGQLRIGVCLSAEGRDLVDKLEAADG